MTAYIPIPRTNTFPTRECLVCQRKEDPTSCIVYTDKAWLCDKCRAALIKIVKETEKGGE